MNRAGFLLSGLAVLIGIVILFCTTIINLVMPKIGRVAFQAAAVGSYTPNDYYINFSLVNLSAIMLVISGGILGYIFYRQEFNSCKE